MKIAFLFAGQGAQKKNMGFDLYQNDEKTKELFDLFPAVRDLIFGDDEAKLNETKYAQPAILLESYAVSQYLERNGIKAEYTCGLSLGEYSALTYSNVMNIEDAIKITSKRGDIMQNALPLGTSTMAAVIATPVDVIEKSISGIDGVCEIANYNSPAQIVITGDNAAIDKAMENLKANGAKKVIKLNVSGAFHSSLLNNASKELRAYLDTFTFNKPTCNMVYNIYGTESNDLVNDILEKQIKTGVKFMQSVEYMINKGVDTFIEIGPGTALSGFVRKINPNVKIYNTDTFDEMNKIIGGNL